MRKSIGVLGVLVCLMLPLVASAESNSSHLNRERLEVGRALIEVTFDNLGSTSNTTIRSSMCTASGI
jgi:hypothetical protein